MKIYFGFFILFTAITFAQDIDIHQAKKMIDSGKVVLIDVRTPGEFSAGHIKSAKMIDFYADSFKQEIEKLDKTKDYLFYCRSGNRSGQTRNLVQSMGFKGKIYNMAGGIRSWRSSSYPEKTN